MATTDEAVARVMWLADEYAVRSMPDDIGVIHCVPLRAARAALEAEVRALAGERDALRAAAMAVSVALDEIGVHIPNDAPWRAVRGADWLEDRVGDLRGLVPSAFADAWVDRYCDGPAPNPSSVRGEPND